MQPEKSVIDALIQSIYTNWGYDFRNYAYASLVRRITRCAEMAGVPIPELNKRVLGDKKILEWFIENLTVNVTEMFRDPEFYRLLRTEILPKLDSYPNINIWHAGCSTGEEVYSLAILLKEQNLLHRCRIYATDLNPLNLQKAQKGIIPISAMRDYTQNYRLSGGIEDFSHYYTARYGNAIISKEFREEISFVQHNLATDGVFNEFHLIVCRNVLIYFNRELQNRVLNLLTDSLSPLGYLALGTKETLNFSTVSQHYEAVSKPMKIFRKRS